MKKRFLVGVFISSVFIGCVSLERREMDIGLSELENSEYVSMVENEEVKEQGVKGSILKKSIASPDLEDRGELIKVEIDGKYELHDVLKMVLGSLGYSVSCGTSGMVDVFAMGSFNEKELLMLCKGVCESLGYVLRVDGKGCSVLKQGITGDLIELVKSYKFIHVELKREMLTDLVSADDVKYIVLGNVVVLSGRRISVEKVYSILVSLDVDFLSDKSIRFVKCFDADKVLSALVGVLGDYVKVLKVNNDLLLLVSENGIYVDYTEKLIKSMSISCGGSQVYVYRCRYRSVDEVKKYLESFEKIEMYVDSDLSAIFFRCSPEKFEMFRGYLKYFDVLPKQVLMRLYMVDIRATDDFGFGMDYSSAFDNFRINKSSFSSSVTGGLNGVFEVSKVKAFFRVLDKVLDAKVISRPSVYMRTGRESEIKFTRSVPVLTAKGQGQGVNTGILQQVEYRDVGIIFKVTPVCSGNNIIIDIYVENSSLQKETGVEGNPLFLKDAVRSNFIIRDGAFCVMGGIKYDNQELSSNGIPFLSRLSFLGYIFGGKKRSYEKREMLVCLFPKVVRDELETDALNQSLLDSMKINFN